MSATRDAQREIKTRLDQDYPRGYEIVSNSNVVVDDHIVTTVVYRPSALEAEPGRWQHQVRADVFIDGKARNGMTVSIQTKDAP